MTSEASLLYELALMSVAIAGGYWGWFFIRRQPQGTPTFGLMLVASAALSTLGWIGRHTESELLGIAGAIGVGAGACLFVVGPVLRTLARRFAAAEHFGVAARLLDVADVLAPGSGAGDEKAMLGAMREIRDGKIERTVDALTMAKQRAPAEAKLAIDERIAMLYLAAYRWDEAIAHAEANLFGATPPDDGGNALRRALGIAPPVWIELLGAYGRKGDLDRAATMLARLEDVCEGRQDAAVWLHRGRLMFLALAGRVDAVEALVMPKRSRHMTAAARTYWLAVAHERRGDEPAARDAYDKARSRSRGRPRVMIEKALAELPTARRAELGSAATEIVARVEAAPAPKVIRPPRVQGPWATQALLAIMIAAAACISLFIGDGSDLGALTRGGAIVHGFVPAEPWRIVAAIFIHVGTVHLVLNAIALWFVGRFAEEMFGAVRTIAIFALAGIAGSIASYYGDIDVTAGASGAIFGLLGAGFVELTLYRRLYRTAMRRGMWARIGVVLVALVGFGMLYPMVDNWAHGAGLVVGALAGAALTPHARWAIVSRYLAPLIALAFAAAVAATAVLVVRTSVAESYASLPTARRTVGDLSVVAPTGWIVAGTEIYAPDVWVLGRFGWTPGSVDLRGPLAALTKGAPGEARERKFETTEAAGDPLVTLPAPWHGSELVAQLPDAFGNRQRYRMIVAARPLGNGVALATLYAPETIVRAAPGYFGGLLGSVAIASSR